MDNLAALVAVLMAFLVVLLLIALAAYIVGAIFLMKVLRRAGHPNPVAAWVPLWNTASMYQVAGISKPWVWVGIVYGGGLVSGLLADTESSLMAFLSSMVGLAVGILAVLLTVWMARGIQAGLGLDSAGGVVLAVLVQLVWVIWMGVRADKAPFYDAQAAESVGSTFPLSKYVASIGS